MRDSDIVLTSVSDDGEVFQTSMVPAGESIILRHRARKWLRSDDMPARVNAHQDGAFLGYYTLDHLRAMPFDASPLDDGYRLNFHHNIGG